MDSLFVSPDDAWLDAFGVWPEPFEGEDFVFGVVIPVRDGADLHVSWCPPARSVRLRATRDGRDVIDVYREQSCRLLAFAHRDVRAVVLEYEGVEAKGELAVLLAPELLWTDKLLRG